MDKMRLFVITHDRPVLLNKVLHHTLEDTDFADLKDTLVFVSNNSLKFNMEPCFEGRVIQLHNIRPPWMLPNLAETHNQILVTGFGSLADPQTELVVHIHDDTFLHPNWVERLLKLHETYNFVVGNLGDGLVSYKPEAVKKIGMWDENFAGIQHKEADYYLRALIWNKAGSCVNDVLHWRCINQAKVVLEVGSSSYNLDAPEAGVWSKRDIEDDVYKKEKQFATAVGDYLLHYFRMKWAGTWKTAPDMEGWLLHWPDEFDTDPPTSPRNVPIFAKYPNFEKHIDDLEEKNYFAPQLLRGL